MTQLHTRAQLLQMDLRSGTTDTDVPAEVDQIVTGTRHLGEVVEDLLLSSQLSRHDKAGVPVDLQKVAADVIAGQSTRAAAHDIALTLVLSTGGPPTVRGHEAALRRVLTALVDNALSHTSAGGHITVELGADQLVVTVVVRDDGTGFDPAAAERLSSLDSRAADTATSAGSDSVLHWPARSSPGTAARSKRGEAQGKEPHSPSASLPQTYTSARTGCRYVP